jgi:Beta protein
MAEHNHYVPILKGRLGEFSALGTLSSSCVADITPLIEVPPVPWDFENEVPAKSLDAHLVPIGENCQKYWGTSRPMFVDLAWISEQATASGIHPLRQVLDDLRTRTVEAIPVAGISRGERYLAAAAEAISEDQQGACIRLDLDDLRGLAILDNALTTTCEKLGVAREEVDLILDFAAYDAAQAPAIEMAASMALTSLPTPKAWRSLTMAGGAFPLNLSSFQGEARIPRADLDVWRGLAINRAQELPRRPAFADYAVQHPEPEEVDPRLMKMSAAVRYATSSEWLILKKKNVRDHGFEQFHEIAADLIGRSEFRGAAFSAGDAAIHACASETSGPGNATTWRKIATNHHIETVVDQIANLP